MVDSEAIAGVAVGTGAVLAGTLALKTFTPMLYKSITNTFKNVVSKLI